MAGESHGTVTSHVQEDHCGLDLAGDGTAGGLAEAEETAGGGGVRGRGARRACTATRKEDIERPCSNDGMHSRFCLLWFLDCSLASLSALARTTF